MQTSFQDLRYAVRVLLKKPGFTVVAMVTLAVGIGLNAAIFSVINAVILRPLPYQDHERLVQLHEYDRRRGVDTSPVSPANLRNWRSQARSFERLSAYNLRQYALTGAEGTEQVEGAWVTSDFFTTLGVTPQLGRTFGADEERSEQGRVVVVSHSFWQNRLGGRPDVIGQTLTLDEAVDTVIGVLRPEYRHPEPLASQSPEIWLPLSPAQMGAIGERRRFLRVIGRLQPGVTQEQAQAEMTTVARQLEQAFPDSNAGWGARVVPLHKQLIGNVSLALFVLQGAVGFVLLIACVNIANLLLVRVAAREKEVAIRGALGAGRLRLVRMFLTESVLLAASGGGAGLLLAGWCHDVLISLAPRDLVRFADVRLDAQVLAFTLLLSLLTVLFFGLVPAWQAARTNINEVLSGSRRAARGQRLRGILVVAEIALTLVLLVGAVLMLRSLVRLQSVTLGFNAENLLTMQVDLLRPRTTVSDRVDVFYEQLLERLATRPGVESAALTSSVPLGRFHGTSTDFAIAGQPAPTPNKRPVAGFRLISPGYFRTMGIPLVRGRFFTGRDTNDSIQVAIINETFARRHFPGTDPVGHELQPGMSSNQPKEIVGVVADFKHEGLQTDPEPELYVPHAQAPWASMALVVRTNVTADSLTATVQRAVWEGDKSASVSRIRTMEQMLSETVARPQFNLLLLGVFAVVALILAAVGVYGVMSYAVSQREHEIGIRMALGAQSRDVLKLVVGQGMTLALVGVALGLLASLALTRLMKNLLFGVSATDPLTLIVVTMLLALTVLLACWLPARRARKVEPLVALRHE